MLQKSKVLEMVVDLPEKFSMDDLFEKMFILEKIEIGLEQVQNGKTINEEELDIEIKEWLK